MSEPTNEIYPVNTILDMAAIPEDRLPAFLDELPRMLSKLRNLTILASSTGGIIEIDLEESDGVK